MKTDKQIERMVDDKIAHALRDERAEIAGQVQKVRTELEGTQSYERRRYELNLKNVSARMEELERRVIQNAERIRALERAEDNRHDYVPEDVLKRLYGVRDRLRAIGR